MQYEHRILRDWPGELRSSHTMDQFKAEWVRTLHDLEYELSRLRAADIVLETAHTDSDLRLGGTLRGNAGTPAHPGVIVSFESRFGPLRYWTDKFWHWRANVRAIALGLEALRAVDRYGISERGEQYTGWARLGAGAATPLPRTMTPDLARGVIAVAAGLPRGSLAAADGGVLRAMYRLAARSTHPDAGGTRQAWDELALAAEILGLTITAVPMEATP